MLGPAPALVLGPLAFEGLAPEAPGPLFAAFPGSAGASAGRFPLSAAARPAFFLVASLGTCFCKVFISRLLGSVLTTWSWGGAVLWSAM